MSRSCDPQHHDWWCENVRKKKKKKKCVSSGVLLFSWPLSQPATVKGLVVFSAIQLSRFSCVWLRFNALSDWLTDLLIDWWKTFRHNCSGLPQTDQGCPGKFVCLKLKQTWPKVWSWAWKCEMFFAPEWSYTSLPSGLGWISLTVSPTLVLIDTSYVLFWLVWLVFWCCRISFVIWHTARKENYHHT